MDLHHLVGLPSNHPEVQALVQQGLATVSPGGVLEVHDGPRSRSLTPAERLETWEEALDGHWGHETFRTHSWAYTRELGFSCGCRACADANGNDREWRIPLTMLRQVEAIARRRFVNRAHNEQRHGQKKDRRQIRKANIKAKALLHYNLTKEQRWELRATKAFTITGGDGRTYRITEGSSTNIQLIQDGVPTHSLCVVFTETNIPVYDLMLAQKLMLESNIEAFLKLAIVRELRPRPDVNLSLEMARAVHARINAALDRSVLARTNAA